MKKLFLYTFLLLVSGYIAIPFQSLAQSAAWHALPADGEAQERHENGFVRAGNKFILLGGRGMKAVDIYDSQTKQWSQGAPPPLEIHHMQAVALDGLVYVVGAFTGSWPYETPLSNMLIYDPLQDSWAIGPEIPANRRRGAAGVVTYQDKIYVVNGIINGHTSGWVSWLDEFDPASNQWRSLPDAPRARDHVHVAVIDDKLYVAGGRRSGFSSEAFGSSVKETSVFDFTTQQWTELSSPGGDIPTPRAGATAAVYQGNLLVIGGESDSQEAAHNEVEMLDVHSGSWTTLSPLNRGRHGTQAIYFDDMVIIGAGSGNRGGGPELNSFEIWSSRKNTDIPTEPLTKGELSASKDKLTFGHAGKGSRERIEIENSSGKQAILLSYILLDNTAAFELELPVKAPVVLAPGQKIPVTVIYKDNTANSPEARLLIKAFGNAAPLSIPLIRE